MKAWVLENIGRLDFKPDADRPQLDEHEVLINVKATGICGSDIPRVYENGAHKMPLIIGHEFSGQVAETGKSVDEKWKKKRVAVFPLLPCGQCTACRRKKYEMCERYRYLGSSVNGGFAEYAAVPEWNLMELPEAVTYEQAAMMEPMAVAVHAMRCFTIAPEEPVAVCGLGTIGQLLIMFLLAVNLHKE